MTFTDMAALFSLVQILPEISAPATLVRECPLAGKLTCEERCDGGFLSGIRDDRKLCQDF
jgi:hypothetical protein